MLLCGCGFRPLYAPELGASISSPDTASPDIAAIFRQMEISQIKDREGQILRGHLIQLLQPDGADASASYILIVNLTGSKSNLAVKKSAFATRANLTVRASFSVSSRSTKSGIASSTAEVTSGYNVFTSEYQTLAAERGARERALEELAHEIHARLGAILVQFKLGQERKPS
ncbi:MAG: LPS assembly lipoprotein LptE [Proteobacteria bacterium]|nr:LPS assembly lipoprotein LptE [Pseudomonadota bacterium]